MSGFEATGLGCQTRNRFCVTLSVSFNTLALLLICNLRITHPSPRHWSVPRIKRVGCAKVTASPTPSGNSKGSLFILCGDELAWCSLPQIPALCLPLSVGTSACYPQTLSKTSAKGKANGMPTKCWLAGFRVSLKLNLLLPVAPGVTPGGPVVGWGNLKRVRTSQA